MQKKKIWSIVKHVCSGIWWAVMLLGAVLIISFMSAHIKGEVPHIGKYSVMNIVSKSMEPTIGEGTYIRIKRVDPEKVQKDDIICFYSTDPTIYGCPNTHRVVEEPYEENGKLYLTTRGDNNPLQDKQPAEGDRLIGVWVRNMTGLTSFLEFMTQNFIWLVGSLVMMTAVVMFASMFIQAKRQETEADDSNNKS
jgi:signal peptidase